MGSVAGLYNPANMISYASTKSFINTFSTSLRVLAAPHNVDVVTVEPGFIDTRMTKKMRQQGSTVPDFEFESAEEMSRRMKAGLEKGGVGVVSWPTRQMVMMNALRGKSSNMLRTRSHRLTDRLSYTTLMHPLMMTSNRTKPHLRRARKVYLDEEWHGWKKGHLSRSEKNCVITRDIIPCHCPSR